VSVNVEPPEMTTGWANWRSPKIAQVRVVPLAAACNCKIERAITIRWISLVPS